jgi:acyl-CoA dehydrogenase
VDRRCKLLIFVGKTDPGAPRHQQQSMIVVPSRLHRARLGRGRVHHCMRLIGLAERGLEKMWPPPAHARDLRQADRGAYRDAVAHCGSAHPHRSNAVAGADAPPAMDRDRNKVAAKQIGMIKVGVPNMATRVIDWAIQADGGGGVADPFLAGAYASARALRLADGPDEVHRNQIVKLELASHAEHA